MQKHLDQPGTPAWHARRAACFNAGDAPAMLSCSPNKTRTQLLAELHSGVSRGFSDYVQERVIDPGHVVEAKCRPLAEEVLGEELQVLSGTLEVDGLSRPLGASLDGITFMDDILWECKTLNDELRAAMPHVGRDSHKFNDGTALPKDKRVQMEQQMLVSGAKRELFSAAALGRDGEIEEERHAWYYSDPALRAEVLAGWRQFDEDLAAYVPPSAAAVEKIVAEPVEALPAPVIQITGQIALTDNFKVFEERLRAFLEQRLIREPKTDQDFADLDLQIKAMKQARESLKAAGAQMLAQVEPVEQATKRQKMLDDLLQQNLKVAVRLLEDEKEHRRGEIIAGGITSLKKHVEALNARLGKPYMPQVPADFNGVVKGLKSLTSMEDKVASELARAKIAAHATADCIDLNLKHLNAEAGDFLALFPDIAAVVLKDPQDFVALVQFRVADQKAKDAKRAEAAREQIRQQERERAEQLQREAQEAEDVLIRSLWANARRIEQDRVPYIERAIATFESAARDWENDPRPRVAEAVALAREEMRGKLDAAKARAQAAADEATQVVQQAATTPPPAPAPAAAPAVAPVRAARLAIAAVAPTADAAPTLSLGTIKTRIAPIQITADGLTQLGFTGVKERGSVLYHEHQYPLICEALIHHLEAALEAQAA